jgi:hypothetical protein
MYRFSIFDTENHPSVSTDRGRADFAKAIERELSQKRIHTLSLDIIWERIVWDAPASHKKNKRAVTPGTL